MASNFGQLRRDIIGCNYFILADKVIDCERNVFVSNVYANHFIGNLTGNVIAKLIQEQNSETGLTIAGNVRISNNANIDGNLVVCGTLYTDDLQPKTANSTLRIESLSANTFTSNVITSNIINSNVVNSNVVCANVEIQTRALVRKDANSEIMVMGNLVIDSNSMVKGLVCGNLYTHRISKKSANVEIEIAGNLVLDANSVVKADVIGDVCGNVNTFEINEKSPGFGIFMTGNVNIEGGLGLPKGAGTASPIELDEYDTIATLNSPAGTISTTSTLPGSSAVLSIQLVNGFITLTSIVMVTIREYTGTDCAVLGNVTPSNGEALIEIKGVNGSLDGDVTINYLVIC